MPTVHHLVHNRVRERHRQTDKQVPTPLPVHYIQDFGSLYYRLYRKHIYIILVQMSGYTNIWPTNILCSPSWHTGPMSFMQNWSRSPVYSNKMAIATSRFSTLNPHMTGLHDIHRIQLQQLLLPNVGTTLKHNNRVVCKHVKTSGLPIRKVPAFFSLSRMTQPLKHQTCAASPVRVRWYIMDKQDASLRSYTATVALPPLSPK